MTSPVHKTKVHTIEIPRIGELVLISELGQVTGSFKFRAAWNVVNNIPADHFVAASSGNFGQALAKATQLKNKQATIVMPTTSSKVKIASVKNNGANVVLVDTTVESRASRVERIMKENPSYYRASAYDCPYVIEGNASLGEEIADMFLDIDSVFVPIGGGGLSSGIITGLCRKGSSIAVWGAEPALANDAAHSLRLGQLYVHPQEPQTIADGARTISLGMRNWEILREGLKGILEIEEREISCAMAYLAEHGIRVEPTGALAVAAGIRRLHMSSEERIACVLSGGNVDEDVYQNLCEKGRDWIIQNEF